ncbi:hypothetical protein QD357_05855 [Rhizobium sp. BR 317]|uniref:hypothetical protein n=1 Tax=Rhizobium sp. BR 317 TaxID=3040015 RepID=UPI0039BF46AC
MSGGTLHHARSSNLKEVLIATKVAKVLTANQIYRNWELDGVPSSGNHSPKLGEIRAWGSWIEGVIAAFTANGGLIYSSLALLNADLAHAANSMAWVVGDATVANNGIYRKNGASGSGSWTRVADLPYSFIVGTDAGAGTPNAIQATTSIPVSGAALIVMNVFEANTASPVTVSFNNGAVLTIKTNSGNDPAVGGLVAGMLLFGYISGTTFRLISDQASNAIVAAAEAAQVAAEEARDVALSAASANISNVISRAVAQSIAFPAGTSYVRTAGDAVAGDLGAAIYAPIASPPILGFQDLNGHYWELRENEILPEMAGAVANDNSKSAANKAAFQKAANTGLILSVPGKTYYCDPGVTFEFGGAKGKKGKSQIVTGDTSSANFFVVDSTDPVVFEDLYFIANNLAKLSGAAIHLNSSTSINQDSRIAGCIFAQFPICINTLNAYTYTFMDNVFSQYDIGIIVQDDISPDGGDSQIYGNRFVTLRGSPNEIGVLQYNSGGMKFFGNKVNGGKTGYLFSAKGGSAMPTQSTSILLIESNSFEGQQNNNIYVDRDGSANPSISFSHLLINGNQLNLASSTAAANNVGIGSALNLKWAIVSNNIVQLSPIAGSSGINIAAVSHASILGNVFGATGVGKGTGVTLGANSFVTLGPNRYDQNLAGRYSAVTPGNVEVIGNG